MTNEKNNSRNIDKPVFADLISDEDSVVFKTTEPVASDEKLIYDKTEPLDIPAYVCYIKH